MSPKLLNKLTLDEVVEIASQSYEHAAAIFKSRIFIDKPVSRSLVDIPTKREPNTEDDINSLLKFLSVTIDDISYKDIFDYWLKTSYDYHTSDYQNCVEKLKRPELLAEDFSYQEHCDNTVSHFGRRSWKHSPSPSFNQHPNTPKKLCRNYIARSITELDVERLFLVAQEAHYVLNKKRLVELARKSPEYASAILDEYVSKGKLNVNMLEEIKGMSEKHQKIISRYITSLVCHLPIAIIHQKPQLAKSVAMQLINNIFYKPNNPLWKAFQIKYPEKTSRINEILKYFKYEQLLSSILVGIANISLDCAKAVLSILESRRYFNQTILNMLASKNEGYRMLVISLLPGEQRNNNTALRQ